MLTIFTPAYNRADTLLRLYETLKNQTDMDFEWILIDDGSTDNTKKIVQDFLHEGVLDITYKYTKNGGKMRAINSGVKLARGEFFFIVDSDDYVSNDCVEKVLKTAETLPKEMGGMVFRKANIESGAVNTPFPSYSFDSTPTKVFFRDKILGDKAEVIRTKLLIENPFPEIEGEKFIPEGYIWNRIGESYGYRYVDEPIYFFQYLEDGYTKNFHRCMNENPKGFTLYYRDILNYDIPIFNKLKFLIRLLQCYFYRISGGK